MPSVIRRRGANRGFTLIELLVVIGIICILLGILLPVVSTMRKKAQQTDTAAEITKLATAINNYYQDYRAYPGPLPDSMCWGYQNSPQTTNLTGVQYSNYLTTSENLVLGLLGGIQAPASVGATSFTYNPSLVGKGPQSLNYLSPAQNSAYFDVNPNTELPTNSSSTNPYNSWCQATGGIYAKWTLCVPEFLDHYSNPHPILYLRAQAGARGSICDQNQGGTGTSPSQYYSTEMQTYWVVYSSTTLLSNPTFVTNTTSPFSTPDANNSNVPLYQTALSYFQNPNIAGTARAQDAFILISAGYDGIYGTTDDIVYPPQ